jgi:hypothetical protein
MLASPSVARQKFNNRKPPFGVHQPQVSGCASIIKIQKLKYNFI